jgi:hypothetical protein
MLCNFTKLILKGLAKDKSLNLIFGDEEKKFYNIDRSSAQGCPQ